MNCTEVHKALYAFADGQLGAKSCVKVVSHIEACAACRHIVDEHRALRGAMGRDLERIPVPSGLQDKIRLAIAAERSSGPEVALDMAARSSDAGVTVPATFEQTSARAIFTIRRLAVAACVVVAVGAIWKYAIPHGSGPGQALASLTVKKHNHCCSHHATHHGAGIPRDHGQAAGAIDEHFDYAIRALAPDLTSHGFEFESANFCGIRAAGCTDGGHIIYVRSNGDGVTRFSVFSVPRREDVDHFGSGAVGEVTGPLTVPQGGDRPDVHVVMWRESGTNYFCCGNLDPNVLSQLTDEVRLAMQRPPTAALFAMLTGTPARP